jgi:hypothetical protein
MSFMAAAIPRNTVQSFRLSGDFSCVKDDDVVRCHVRPDAAGRASSSDSGYSSRTRRTSTGGDLDAEGDIEEAIFDEECAQLPYELWLQAYEVNNRFILFFTSSVTCRDDRVHIIVYSIPVRDPLQGFGAVARFWHGL